MFKEKLKCSSPIPPKPSLPFLSPCRHNNAYPLCSPTKFHTGPHLLSLFCRKAGYTCPVQRDFGNLAFPQGEELIPHIDALRCILLSSSGGNRIASITLGMTSSQANSHIRQEKQNQLHSRDTKDSQQFVRLPPYYVPAQKYIVAAAYGI